jgi:NH3-dependent NAD+ synthetase
MATSGHRHGDGCTRDSENDLQPWASQLSSNFQEQNINEVAQKHVHKALSITSHQP